MITVTLPLGLLEGVLFANIRFHDTVSRGRLLNRFGKDFEGELWMYNVRVDTETFGLQALTARYRITLVAALCTDYQRLLPSSVLLSWEASHS